MSIQAILLDMFLDFFMAILPQPEALLQWTLGTAAMVFAVLALRGLLKDRFSCRVKYALWAVVLVRALLPFQFPVPTPFSTANLVPEAPESWEEHSIPAPFSSSQPIEEAQQYYQGLEPGHLGPTTGSIGYVEISEDGKTIQYYIDLYSPAQIVQCIYLAGIAVTAGALIFSNARFGKKLRKTRQAFPVENYPVPVYVAEGLPSPCLVGVFHPAVYLTPEAAVDERQLHHVLTHELTHYAHGDHIWAVLRCVCLTFHWFDPLVWLAVAASKRDCELACDEGAVAKLGEEERIPYGRTLVDMVAQNGRPDLLSCSTTMTEGKKTIQQRIELLVKHPETKKTALFAAISLLALAAVFAFAGESRTEAENSGLTTSEEGYVQLLELLDNDLPLGITTPLDETLPISEQPPYITDPAFIAGAKELLRSRLRPLEEGMEPIPYDELQLNVYLLTLFYQMEDGISSRRYCTGDWKGEGYVFLREQNDSYEEMLIPVARITSGMGEAISHQFSEMQKLLNDQSWQNPNQGYLEYTEALKSLYAFTIDNEKEGMYTTMNSVRYADVIPAILDLLGQAQPISGTMEDFTFVSGKRIVLFSQPEGSAYSWGTHYYELAQADGVYYLTILHDEKYYTPIATLTADQIDRLYALVQSTQPGNKTSMGAVQQYLEDVATLYSVAVYDSPTLSSAPTEVISNEATLGHIRTILDNDLGAVEEELYKTLVQTPHTDWTIHGPYPVVYLDTGAQAEYQYLLYHTEAGEYALLRRSENAMLPVAVLNEEASQELVDLLREKAVSPSQSENETGLPEPEPSIDSVDSNATANEETPFMGVIEVKYSIEIPALMDELTNLFLGDPETVALNESANYDMADWLTNWTNSYVVEYGIPYWLPDAPEGWYAKAIDAGSFYSIVIPERLVEKVLAVCEKNERYLTDPADLPLSQASYMHYARSANGNLYVPTIPQETVAEIDAMFQMAQVASPYDKVSYLSVMEADGILDFILPGQSEKTFLFFQEDGEHCLVSAMRRTGGEQHPVTHILPAGASEDLWAMMEALSPMEVTP